MTSIDAFLSYSHLDRAFAVRVHQALVAAGKDVWLDEEDILPASRWAKDLKEAIEDADSFVAIISPEWAASDECRKEMDHAVALDKRVIPLSLRAPSLERLPEVVRAQQFVPPRGGFEDDFAASMALLIAAIETDTEWVREHTRWAKKALEWEEHDRDRSFLLSGNELAASEQYLAEATGKRPEPGPRQSAFVLASRQGATLRQRRLLGGVSVALVVALVLGALALLQWRQAVSNQRVAQSRQIAAESETALTSDPELSTLLAMQALRLRPTAQAEAALRDALPQLQVVRTLTGVTTMQAAAFSPDGTELVTGDLDGNLTIWSASSGQRLHSRRDPQRRAIVSVAFNAAGTQFVTASLDGAYGAATIWNAETDRPVRQLLQPASEQVGSSGDFNSVIDGASFNPSGTEVVTAGGNAGRVWSLATGQVVQALQPSGQDPVSSAVFSPDGSEVVTTRGKVAEVWTLSTGQPESVITEPGGIGLTDATFSPDGTRIVTASSDGSARVWNVRSGQQTNLFTQPVPAVLNGASFSPDGTEVVTASDDGTATTWSVRTNARLLVLRGHRGPVFAASFSPDGREVATASEDGTAKLWNAQPAGTRRVLAEPNGSALYQVSVNRSGSETAAVTTRGVVDIWDASSGRVVRRLTVPDGGWINGVDFSPDGKEIVSAGEADGTARVWNAATGRQLFTVKDPSGANMYTAMFDAPGRRFVTASEDGTARIWNAATGKELAVIAEPTGGGIGVVFSASFSPNGREVVTSSLDGTIRVWNAGTGKQLQVMTEPGRSAVITAAFSPNGAEVVTSSADGSARIWNAATGQQVDVMAEPGGASMYSASFSPDGAEVVTSSADGTARIWSAGTGEELTVFTTGSEVRDSIYTRDGAAVVSTTFAGRVVIWSTRLAGSLPTLERLADRRVTRQLTLAERKAYL